MTELDKIKESLIAKFEENGMIDDLIDTYAVAFAKSVVPDRKGGRDESGYVCLSCNSSIYECECYGFNDAIGEMLANINKLSNR